MAEENLNSIKDENSDGTSISQIEKKLTQINPKIFEGLKKERKDQIIQSVVLTLSKTHIGPLPDVETLTGYANLIPDGANRIMTMAESQVNHRISMESSVVKGQTVQSILGQVFAFIIAISFLACATYCILEGHDWPGALLGAGGVTALVTAFIKGRNYQSRNLASKNPK
jgi:uncharacterized membrane protein